MIRRKRKKSASEMDRSIASMKNDLLMKNHGFNMR